MKTIQERIDEIQVNGGNLCHILSTGKINGSLFTDIVKVANEHADQEKQALKEKHDAELSMIKGLIENAFVAGRSKEPWADFKQRISDSGKITNW